MQKSWHDKAWGEYLYWQTQDKKTIRKINSLLRDIERNNRDALGHAELLKENLTGWASVKIDKANRLIFRIEDGVIQILSCRGHYSDK